MSSDKKYIQLKIKRDEEVAKIFEIIKEKIGVKHDVEVLRYLINYYKEKELKKEQVEGLAKA